VSASEDFLASFLVWREGGGGRLFAFLLPEPLNKSVQIVVDCALEGAAEAMGRHDSAASREYPPELGPLRDGLVCATFAETIEENGGESISAEEKMNGVSLQILWIC